MTGVQTCALPICRDRAGFEASVARLAAARGELEAAELRWLELEEKRDLAERLEDAGG